MPRSNKTKNRSIPEKHRSLEYRGFKITISYYEIAKQYYLTITPTPLVIVYEPFDLLVDEDSLPDQGVENLIRTLIDEMIFEQEELISCLEKYFGKGEYTKEQVDAFREGLQRGIFHSEKI